jgi:preprotein translocase subunit Sss1
MKVAAIAAAVLVAIGFVAYVILWLLERFKKNKKA